MQGKKHSIATRRKMSASSHHTKYWLGKKVSPEIIRKRVEGRKGFKHTDEYKNRLSINCMGNKNPFYGKRHALETKLKWSRDRTGERGKNWKGGITPINTRIRGSREYKLWRKAVFERDNYLCIWGGKKHGNKLHADHIKPFSLYPELRFAIDNGRTLCVDCHRKTDTYAGRCC